jgi:polysaccharide export outer membrane protein
MRQKVQARGIFEVVLVCMVFVSLAGCGTLSREVIAEATDTQKDFLLGPEDVLDIVVWRNQDLSRQGVVIRPDGKISMPLIGEVMASGRTADQLANQIAERLKEFKESPSVSVSVKEVNSYYVYVMGEVAKPGKFQLKSHTNVLQAIALAGGFTNFASKSKMQVVRHATGADGKLQEMRIPVRYDDLVFGTGKIHNVILKTGDVLVVP